MPQFGVSAEAFVEFYFGSEWLENTLNSRLTHTKPLITKTSLAPSATADSSPSANDFLFNKAQYFFDSRGLFFFHSIFLSRRFWVEFGRARKTSLLSLESTADRSWCGEERKIELRSYYQLICQVHWIKCYQLVVHWESRRTGADRSKWQGDVDVNTFLAVSKYVTQWRHISKESQSAGNFMLDIQITQAAEIQTKPLPSVNSFWAACRSQIASQCSRERSATTLFTFRVSSCRILDCNKLPSDKRRQFSRLRRIVCTTLVFETHARQ